MTVNIREASEEDFEFIWPIFHEVVLAGDTYAYDPETTKEEAFRQWMEVPAKTFVAEDRGQILGTYFIKKNYSGPGSHVCNCGYMVPSRARGLGVATAMCEHSQITALEMGFKAMQFNLVVETNVGAVRLWQKLGFKIIGTIPKAFLHSERGYVGAHVMYKWLAPE
jgi:RimJ/RimL family protein N-acetyltransferase